MGQYGKDKKAMKKAQYIMDMKIKVQSTAVKQIKEKVKDYLDQDKNT